MKTPTQPHVDLRLLIRNKALTPEGFMLHHAKGMEASHYASRHACRMVLAGVLFRVKVKGQPLHYMRTQELADQMTAKLLAIKPAPKAPPPTKRRAMTARLLDFSKTPEGATWAQFADLKMCTSNFSLAAKTLCAEGRLFRAKVKGHPLRYFDTQAAADAWMQRTHPTQRQPRVYVPVVRAPKVAKAPKVVKRTARQQMQVTPRKAYVPPAPRKDAEIVWPARMPECRMMGPGRYAVSVPMVRMGSPEWRAGVGA